ncbi:MAG: UDP-N-acetylglucosamine 2-epimerase (non-hydrolyzing) [Acidobacteriota bacterium]|nr:UDP-N-acetylglucosamine 2-epimerase (non-hydrolyzing) [Acidobacteriota bacterium]
MINVLNIVGARPNFMKIAPVFREMKARPLEFEPMLVHTGQHYDEKMSDTFFDDLDIPRPDVDLGVGSASHAVQTAKIMLAFEPVVSEHKPDWVVVVGDVNSTIACALVCSKLGIKVAHVEAGLRSYDRSMPEEINRVLTDSISDLLLTPSIDGNENLAKEGIPESRIKLVGNVMIDSLMRNLEIAKRSEIRRELKLDGDYAVMTLHRPSNVDERSTLEPLLEVLIEISERIPIVFPAHPRTASKIEEFDFGERIQASGILLTEPLGYLDFLNVMSGSKFVLTDSGGLQEETTALSIPCLTLRENTERPITIEVGTNRLVGVDPLAVRNAALEILDGGFDVSNAKVPPLWDGRTAVRICDALAAAS